MSDESALLRAIGLAPGDDLPRLVYADWLDEHGDTARAKFIRVQCELANSQVADDRRVSLKIQELQLFDAHRNDWLATLGISTDAVRFQRGLISELRVMNWDRGKVLDVMISPQFAMLEELDLSRCSLGDAGLEHFARVADFPALRKLRLNGNGITQAGAESLAFAKGIPRLAEVSLFDNDIGDGGSYALRHSENFLLVDLDCGVPATGYLFSPGQADGARREYIREHLRPFAAECFGKYEHLQSAMLCVAQYWADEADDAVHAYLIVSELSEPVLEGANSGDREESGNDPNVPNTRVKQQFSEGGSALYLYGTGVPWDDNGDAIPLWAAFAPEGGSQEHGELSESYAPAVLFYRHGGYEILPMSRPQLDGILPESQ